MRARAILQRDDEGEGDPHANFAVEEAVFLRNRGVTLRLWANGESVVIGRAQLARFETDLGYCQRNAIPVVRRFTAGGAVYNGPGNVNWSLFVGREAESRTLRYERDPSKIFGMASSILVESLSRLGVVARLDPPSTIRTSEGKVSGMAAYISRRGILCHGTLLLDADLSKLQRVTTPAPTVLAKRYPRSRDTRTANTHLDADSFIRAYFGAFVEATGLEVDSVPVEREEREEASRLLSEKYSREAWNLGDPFERTVTEVPAPA